MFSQLHHHYPELKMKLKRIRQYIGRTFFSSSHYEIPTCFNIDDKDNLDFIISTTPPQKGFTYNKRETGAYFGNIPPEQSQSTYRNLEAEKRKIRDDDLDNDGDVINLHLNFYT